MTTSSTTGLAGSISSANAASSDHLGLERIKTSAMPEAQVRLGDSAKTPSSLHNENLPKKGVFICKYQLQPDTSQDTGDDPNDHISGPYHMTISQRNDTFMLQIKPRQF